MQKPMRRRMHRTRSHRNTNRPNTTASTSQPAPTPYTENIMAERLQKWLARAGMGSRRGVEEWIRAGRVTVNVAPAQLGSSVADGDVVCVDGRVSAAPPPVDEARPRVLMYHKPAGEICSQSDPEGRATVIDRLPRVGGRWIAVGRHDLNTQGLKQFTNDGEQAKF